jgi:ubiquinone/menaquinone biosynthesis C-methylase UbiE
MYWFARRYYAALVRRHAPAQNGSRRLLELGCGLGHLLGLLSNDFKCTGLDIADYAVSQTKRNAPKADAMLGSAEQLEAFPDQAFDVIVALHLVEHLAEPETALMEMGRLLTPGGLLLFATPNPHYSLRRLKDQPDAISKDPTHISVHPPEQWHKWALGAGFRMTDQFGDGLWDVPYLPLLPKNVQFAIFGLPSLVQVLLTASFIPVAYGVNTITICHKT